MWMAYCVSWSKMADQDIKALLKAADFAAKRHRDQRRKDKEETPYINHPIGVANSIANEGGVTDVIVLQAALLHDTVEDTDTTIEEIEEHFGPKVRSVVAEVTDDKTLPKAKRKCLQVEHAPHKSKEAKVVKLADKLYNLRDLKRQSPKGWSEERVQQYYEWAGQVVSGLRGSNETLERELAEILSSRGVSMDTKDGQD